MPSHAQPLDPTEATARLAAEFIRVGKLFAAMKEQAPAPMPGVDFTHFAVLNNLMPLSLAPTRQDLEQTGLYDVLRDKDVHLVTAHQSIGAKRASRVEAEQLGEQPGAAVLTMTRTTYDDKGEVVEFGHHVYRASRYTFDSTLFTR